ncbi:Cyclopropane-fatty-acyl-phospholipid synthase [Aquicella siphonis]|uniref:Cyclopropane-fatty-acyl-phospholipid synthase n=1 Tax=Aquicella siphonis TaxID=254247 RepID=A0A5E4PJH4_9COXI|nr:cyclopropane fatty acyl phospholipid synthase [Aquicella siphonis]VVC77180.1 Cyclopropane-fatty-acyl-phospholipid synthase [Aquicella siphonis]
MNENAMKRAVHEILQSADIKINGDRPWDILVHNQEFYRRVLKEGTLGLGESYMDHWWDCDHLDQFFERVIRFNLASRIKSNPWLLFRFIFLKYVNMQTKRRARTVGKRHYDLGNRLFQSMLDNRMNYTCGYWEKANNLDEAQRNKLELTCQKLMLEPGMRMLDIGCGFGSLARYAAENYGVSVVGITISREQSDYAKNNCAGLPVEIRFQDYRDINDKFDRIASLGMFEHVGHLNYHHYMKIVKNSLKDDGLFLLHTIGGNISQTSSDAWINRYIFPNGMLPSITQIGKASEGLLVMEDWHNFGADYAKTLMAWHANFDANWDKLKQHYDDRFYRMWSYYLLSCAGAFRARSIQLWQIIFSTQGVPGGYRRPFPDFEPMPSLNTDESQSGGMARLNKSI